ncbi:MAG: M15 family metallopeptidase [Chitinispirillales bacterium]|nr:M15 family metallopeptidase [Chitinispirillales bacterium]
MRGIERLHPEVQAMAQELQGLCRENGLPLLITETWRTKEEQDALYAKGRTVPGKIVTNCAYPYSAHCWGVAFDFCRNVRGKEYETADGFFQKVGHLGKEIGLFWGGDFKSFKDMPHFEHPLYMINNSVKTLVIKWGTPEAFKKSWAAVK